ncbi:MAG TPA: WecB/TagA/CpsF family glycosyltransferase [Bacteroidales bacterium]|nr:WecB/TagA/CpsF family glycosyltransferase [Bacteroidales bacterium]
MYLTEIKDQLLNESLSSIPDGKLLISAMNAYCFCILQKDETYKSAIKRSHYLLPDGISIVWAMKFLTGQKVKKIAGEELFHWEMARLQQKKGKCFFLGSCLDTLEKIVSRIKYQYPDVGVGYYSPPFKHEFNDEENAIMINEINNFSPDVLFIGMTAPKQEKWGAIHFENLKTNHICCIGAVFDFCAKTKRRAPNWIINIGCEWLFRLIQEPRRNWRRYIIGNSLFIHLVMMEKVARISSFINIHANLLREVKNKGTELQN